MTDQLSPAHGGGYLSYLSSDQRDPESDKALVQIEHDHAQAVVRAARLISHAHIHTTAITQGHLTLRCILDGQATLLLEMERTEQVSLKAEHARRRLVVHERIARARLDELRQRRQDQHQRFTELLTCIANPAIPVDIRLRLVGVLEKYESERSQSRTRSVGDESNSVSGRQ